MANVSHIEYHALVSSVCFCEIPRRLRSAETLGNPDWRSCPKGWCRSGGVFALSGGFCRFHSSRHGGQLEDWILAQWSDGFQGHVAGALHGPFIVLLE